MLLLFSTDFLKSEIFVLEMRLKNKPIIGLFLYTAANSELTVSWQCPCLSLQEEYYGKQLILADRDLVEQGADEILKDADVDDVAFLVVGDPFGWVTAASERIVVACVTRPQGLGRSGSLLQNQHIPPAVNDRAAAASPPPRRTQTWRQRSENPSKTPNPHRPRMPHTAFIYSLYFFFFIFLPQFLLLNLNKWLNITLYNKIFNV